MNLLIANRGEIARRIIRTARELGRDTVAVYSDADRDALHVREADTAVRIGGAAPRESYLNIAAIIEAAKRSEADAVHPGYGFLAENADFAQAVIDAELLWIGPSPAVIRQMGDKAEAKRIAAKAGVPTVPGGEATAENAARIGYPLMIKAVAGGGGRGMRRVASAAEFDAALEAAQSEAQHAFGDGRVMLERAIEDARHIEVQILADQHGHVVHLGERDCSVQRRHQKLIEETPSPAVDAALREKLGAAAVALARAVEYEGVGTVEFLLDARRAVLLHGDEHAAPGRASGDRGDAADRSGRVAASYRLGRAVHGAAGRTALLGPRHRGAALRRGPGAGFPAAGGTHRTVATRRGRAHRSCASIPAVRFRRSTIR